MARPEGGVTAPRKRGTAKARSKRLASKVAVRQSEGLTLLSMVQGLPRDVVATNAVDKAFLAHLESTTISETGKLALAMEELETPNAPVALLRTFHREASDSLAFAKGRVFAIDRAVRKLHAVRDAPSAGGAVGRAQRDVSRVMRVMPTLDPLNITDVALMVDLLAIAQRSAPDDKALAADFKRLSAQLTDVSLGLARPTRESLAIFERHLPRVNRVLTAR
ncbi:MAG: hypothetical protein IPL79_09915 [Myxococcales bacterium]|nr:hypothetical protein [Myxococcales bacterium]